MKFLRPAGQTGASPTPRESDASLMIHLVRRTGVRFPNRRHLQMPSLRPVKGPYEYLHAEAASDMEGDPRRIAVVSARSTAP